ncbi:3'-5' exonuclease [Nonomuraea sp. NPDC046802]|uniref:3'-5' exonuclease n=1 Tax=Nonomuraea sp. NPDC046802 TaxID=3154919 RepID=UPI0033E8F1C0
MDFGTWPRLLVVDVEGNGAVPPDLVEVAAIPIAAGRPVPEDARCTLIRPPRPITPFAARIHHITSHVVQAAPSWEEVAPDVHAHLQGAWIAAHNARVDYDALRRHLPRWEPAGVVDTLRLARATYPDASKYSLDALLAYTNVPLAGISGQRHRAGYDAHATALLLLDLARHYDTWDALIAVAIPPGMPGFPPQRHEEQTLW